MVAFLTSILICLIFSKTQLLNLLVCPHTDHVAIYFIKDINIVGILKLAAKYKLDFDKFKTSKVKNSSIQRQFRILTLVLKFFCLEPFFVLNPKLSPKNKLLVICSKKFPRKVLHTDLLQISNSTGNYAQTDKSHFTYTDKCTFKTSSLRCNTTYE